jgi:UDP-N-acetylmuramoyl-L-alanyl-D-glutamate--2,6-diaminopimelate ligase
LKLYRVAGCHYETAIFTNLTQDHLDFHLTMEEYFQAKMMLFDNRTCTTRIAIVNADDAYGRRILDSRKNSGLAAVSYGFEDDSDYRITTWNSSAKGSEIVISHQGTEMRMQTPLIARFNAYNICGAVAAMNESRIKQEAIVRGIEQMKQVPGRLERIDYGQPYLILIDYAHTEDALRQLLSTVRPYVSGKLIVLFGCGGERDRGKRPLMGKAAAELSDLVVLSSDNPRSEDQLQIIQEVKAGIPANAKVLIYPDREEAIVEALKIVQPGDCFVLAGKGHENYQIVGEEKLHFDEREILASALRSPR